MRALRMLTWLSVVVAGVFLTAGTASAESPAAKPSAQQSSSDVALQEASVGPKLLTFFTYNADGKATPDPRCFAQPE